MVKHLRDEMSEVNYAGVEDHLLTDRPRLTMERETADEVACGLRRVMCLLYYLPICSFHSDV